MINNNRKGSYAFCGKFSLQSYKNGHIVFLLVLLFFASCQNNGTQQTNNEESEKISESETTDDWTIEEEKEDMPLQEELSMLLDSINSFRAQAFASENEKIETTLKLIEEVETSLSSYDAAGLESIKKLQQEVQQSMYDSASLGSEEVMLNYDDATAKLMSSLSNFVRNNEEFNKHARAKLLLNDIMRADQSDFRIRNSLYNEYVSRYNRLLAKSADEIDALGGRYKNLQRLPLFYGGPAS